ncbi:6-phosphogluconolactonase [Schizopora paradoxa]|uniref:6-phosphogluconolactonase n=1 Tax=Schizopora paradoxa TaxID=27342 RepID=A0A0H2SAR7_9AGAM|nr:6-phosphogluconolactonase [Schizopora paradoxa]
MPDTSETAYSYASVFSFPSTGELEDALAQFIIKRQKEALHSYDKFTIALSGGSLPQRLAALAKYPADEVFWDKWHVFYADERAVPLDHEDSNHRLCTEHFFSKVSIPPNQIHTIDASMLDDPESPELDMEELADRYEKLLIEEFANKNAVKFPKFDLILLGMGDDGHTASLFPGHELLTEMDRWVAPIEDSPKPPPKRITFTLPVLNHAAAVAFVVAGGEKAGMIQTVIEHPKEGIPSSRVIPQPKKEKGMQSPKDGSPPKHLFFFLDDEASSKLSHKDSFVL